MDIQFWISLAKNDYKIPEGHTLAELTNILFGYLSNTDPELRDDIAYIVYANFLKREMYSNEDIRRHVDELLSNLEKGVGEIDTDSVFLRTFSVLLLAEIIYNDNKKPLLDKEQAQTILKKGLWYLSAEEDPRGYIRIKGWAHALAHTADLMQELGKSRFVEQGDLERILQGIASKLVRSSNWVYIHGEDERLAKAVIAILHRGLVPIEYLRSWLNSMTKPEISWEGAYMDEEQARAFHNVRNFLRSLMFEINKSIDLEEKGSIQSAIVEAVSVLAPY